MTTFLLILELLTLSVAILYIINFYKLKKGMKALSDMMKVKPKSSIPSAKMIRKINNLKNKRRK